MTSNVGQNYPYTSETEAERAATIARLVAERDGLAGDARGGGDAARRQRPLVGLEVPDQGLPRAPPRRRLRRREARRLRRLRRDLRQDLPALTRRHGRDWTIDPEVSRRRLARPTAALGIAVSADGLRVRLRPGGPRSRLLADRGDGDEHDRVRRGRPVRGGRLRRERPGLAGDHPADRAAQRAPPALFRRARAVAARTSRSAPGA